MKHTRSCSESQEQWYTKCQGPEGTNRARVPAPITTSTVQGLRSPISTQSVPIHPWSSDAATSASPSGSGQPSLSPDNKQAELARIRSHRCMCIWCVLETCPSQQFPWNGTSLLPFSLWSVRKCSVDEDVMVLCCIFVSCTLQELHLRDRPWGQFNSFTVSLEFPSCF